MKISVVGAGYVGLSLAVLLAQSNEVNVIDIDARKVELINKKISPIADSLIPDFLALPNLQLSATTAESAIADSAVIILALPTDLDPVTHELNTKSLIQWGSTIKALNPQALVIIKSTVNIGFTENFINQSGLKNVVFSPEFLREGRALEDNLHPSRIIMGFDLANSQLKGQVSTFTDALLAAIEEEQPNLLFVEAREAEAIKLSSNAYLAMRVAFFNEIDGLIEAKKMNAQRVIQGISLDPRIGDYHNNPSFGFGGYCLPKDTEQLVTQLEQLPSSLLRSVLSSNQDRAKHIAGQIREQLTAQSSDSGVAQQVGIYRLSAKKGSDNFRNSVIMDVAAHLANSGVEVVVYEPAITDETIFGYRIIPDFQEFAQTSTVIVANRYEPNLAEFTDKIYTRDAFGRD